MVTSIQNFHKALDCLNSRLKDTDRKINVSIVEHSGIRNNISHCKDNSSHSRLQKDQNEQNTLNKISHTKQSVINSDIKKCNNSTGQPEKTVKMEKNQLGPGKSKKTVKITNRHNEKREELTE